MEKNNQSLSILFSPCHYIYDEKGWGSEIGWAYNIANRICSINPGSMVVTGMSQSGHHRYPVIEVLKGKDYLDLGIFNSLIFNLKYTFETQKILKSNHIHILHHVLPFGLNSTFNLSIIFRDKKLPAVIGPIQPPLTFLDKDLGVSLTANHQSRHKKLPTDNPFLKLARYLAGYLSKKTLNSADVIIAVNQSAKDGLRDLGISESKILVIPPGINIDDYPHPKKFPQNYVPRVIISSCKLINRKKVENIILAVNILIKKFPDIKLLIIGDGPQKKTLVDLTHKLKLDDWIEFKGYVPYDRMPQEYSKSDIYINASESEGFATVCLEAMAASLCIVSTKVGGFADSLESGVTGLLIDNSNPQSIAAALTKLLEKPELVRKYSLAAHSVVGRFFDWKKAIIPKYINLYSSLRN